MRRRGRAEKKWKQLWTNEIQITFSYIKLVFFLAVVILNGWHNRHKQRMHPTPFPEKCFFSLSLQPFTLAHSIGLFLSAYILCVYHRTRFYDIRSMRVKSDSETKREWERQCGGEKEEKKKQHIWNQVRHSIHSHVFQVHVCNFMAYFIFYEQS